jgi:hypothetical protein
MTTLPASGRDGRHRRATTPPINPPAPPAVAMKPQDAAPFRSCSAMTGPSTCTAPQAKLPTPKASRLAQSHWRVRTSRQPSASSAKKDVRSAGMAASTRRLERYVALTRKETPSIAKTARSRCRDDHT